MSDDTIALPAGEVSDTAAEAHSVRVNSPLNCCPENRDSDGCRPEPHGQHGHSSEDNHLANQPHPTSCCDNEDKSRPAMVEETCSTGCCSSKHLPNNQLSTERLCTTSCCGNEGKPIAEMREEIWWTGCCGSKDLPDIHLADQPRLCTSSCCGNESKPIEMAEEAVSTGCCGSNNSSGQACLRNPNGDCCDTTPGQGACPCCVADIVRGVTSTDMLPHFEDIREHSTQSATGAVEAVLNHLEANVGNLRRCCAILEHRCHSACCLLTTPQSIIPTHTHQRFRACEAASTEELDTRLSILKDAQVVKTGSTLLQLEIGGMDCADCATKVTRAFSRLPSITAVDIDYFTGIAQLRFDPEIISPPAITTYVSRATAFRIREVTRQDAETSSHLHLPVYFDGPPPAAMRDKYDILRGSSRSIWNVSFRVAGEKALRPRDVLADLTDQGGRLAPEPTDQGNDIATRDLWILVVRTTLCMVCTIPILVLGWGRLRPSPVLYGGFSVALATIVQSLAFPMYSSTVRSILFLRQVDMNVLASVSTLVCYIFSLTAYAFEVVGKPFSAPFFETSTLLVTLIYLGRAVQGVSRQSAGSAIRALHRLQTKEVCIVEDGTSRTIDARLLHYGDVIEILPDTLIVTDGVIMSGSSDVDESSVTGESVAVFKFRGSRVIAGTINLNGTLRVQVTRLLHENSLSRMTQLVRHAQSSRVPLQDLADRLSAIVLPLAVTTAGLALLIWSLVDVFVKKRTVSEAAIDGLMKAIAVLVVSCPCAIGLAVPMVTAVSMRILARSGILVQAADILHVAHRVSAVVFDKTGTLSQGLFTVMQSEVFVEGAEHLIYELVKGNNHPVAQGVHRFLQDKVSPNHVTVELPDLSTLPGKGVRATLHGYELLGGNATFTGATSHPTVKQYLVSGHSLFTITLGGVCLAVYGLADLPRPETLHHVEMLNRMGKKVIILSGDNDRAVSRFAAEVGVDEKNAHAACTPEDKQAFIVSLQSEHHEMVLFIGDGTNDGPALAAADASIAVMSGSEVAHTSAGAILLQPDIQQGVLQLFSVARSAEWRSRLSLTWCAVYMVGAAILTSGLAVNFSIQPRWAGLGEVASVLPVVLIGLSMDWNRA